MSPSPTAADFHTPLQTPTGLALPHSEAPKKKNKKKKKKAPVVVAQAGSASETATMDPIAEGEPFEEQMKLVDSLMGKQGIEYYSRYPAQTETSTKEDDGSDKKVR